MATLHLRGGEAAEDRLPLLSNEGGEVDDFSVDVQVRFHGGKGNSSRSSGPATGDAGPRQGASFSADQAAPSRKKKHYSGSEMIVAVFVVAFDTKKGIIHVHSSFEGRAELCL